MRSCLRPITVCILSVFLLGAETTRPSRTFKDVLEKAFQVSEEIRRAEQDLEISESRYDQAIGSILPKISYSHTLLHQDVPPADTSGVSSRFLEENQVTSKLHLSQPIFSGMKEWAGLKVADLERQNQDWAVKNARLQVARETASAFFALLIAEADIENTNQLLNNLKDRVGELERRSRIGRVDRSDLLSAKAQLMHTESDRLEQLRSRDDLNRTLVRLIPGLGPFSPRLDQQGAPQSIGSLQDWLKRADQRPDIIMQSLKLQEAEQSIRMEKADFWPTLSLEGNYYFKRPGVLSDSEWDVTLALTFPLFEGGANLARVRESGAKKVQERLTLETTKRAATQDIENAYEIWRTTTQRLELLKEAVSLSETNYRAQMREYKNGLIPYLEVIQSETSYWEMKRSFDRAVAQQAEALVKLKIAAGELP